MGPPHWASSRSPSPCATVYNRRGQKRGCNPTKAKFTKSLISLHNAFCHCAKYFFSQKLIDTLFSNSTVWTAKRSPLIFLINISLIIDYLNLIYIYTEHMQFCTKIVHLVHRSLISC